MVAETFNVAGLGLQRPDVHLVDEETKLTGGDKTETTESFGPRGGAEPPLQLYTLF